MVADFLEARCAAIETNANVLCKHKINASSVAIKRMDLLNHPPCMKEIPDSIALCNSFA